MQRIRSANRKSGRAIDEYRLGDDAAAAIGEFGNLRKLTLYTTNITDAGVAHLCRNSQLEWLDVSCPLATSASFAEVTRLSQLRHLGTWGWKIDNDDIEQLATLPKLESLGLGTPSVTDESVPYILRLPHIRELRLTGDGITDASLHHFQQHGALERLDLYHTAVNKLSPAAKDLQAALPNCDCVFPRTPEEEARHRRWKISLYKLTPSKLVTRKPSIAKRND